MIEAIQMEALSPSELTSVIIGLISDSVIPYNTSATSGNIVGLTEPVGSVISTLLLACSFSGVTC